MTDLDHGADLRERFDHAMNDLSAPDGLTSAVLADGHRLRRRRRILTASTGVAAAAVITALVAANLGGSAPSTGPQVATQPPAPTPASTQDPKGGGLPRPGPAEWPNDPFPDLPEGWWDAPADVLLAHLRTTLPEGIEITDYDLGPTDRAPGEPGVSAGWLHATLTGPDGPGGFEIILSMPDLEDPPDPVTTTDAAGNEGTTMLATGPSNLVKVKCGHHARYTDTCVEILDANGEPMGRVTTFLQDGTITFHEATFLGPEGGLVYMSAWNATDGKPNPDTPQSAPVPPLTPDQLRDLVQDPAWTAYQP